MSVFFLVSSWTYPCLCEVSFRTCPSLFNNVRVSSRTLFECARLFLTMSVAHLGLFSNVFASLLGIFPNISVIDIILYYTVDTHQERWRIPHIWMSHELHTYISHIWKEMTYFTYLNEPRTPHIHKSYHSVSYSGHTSRKVTHSTYARDGYIQP